MSNNIHDTKVDKIKTQVYSLMNDIKNGERDSEILEDRYHYLFNTSKTLFNLVCKEAKKDNFDKQQFDKNLDQMLKHISRIQHDELTQNEASENIGKLLAKQFIPQYK
jgi:membrane-bound lytic murein transglycosylase B